MGTPKSPELHKTFSAAREAKEQTVYSIADIPEAHQKAYEKSPEVGIAVKVISIHDLDMAGHCFSADFNINVAWKGDKDDGPDIQLYNVIEETEHDQADTKKGDGDFDWYYRVRCRASFRQTFNLRKFPFDTQELKVEVRLKKACRLIHLPWNLEGEACSCDPRCLMDEFVLENAEVRHVYLPSLKFGKISGYDPEAHVVFTVARKPWYWVLNFGLITSVLSSFSFLSFALPVSDVSDRLGIGFTLNLTVVASYYLMADKLPSAPYFTKLEKHILLCMLVTMVVLIENASPSVFGETAITWLERVMLPVMIVGWLWYHFWCYQQIISHSVVDEIDKEE